LLKADEWKEKFLMDIKDTFKVEQLFSNRSHVVWGLPFYNSTDRMPEFEGAFDELLPKQTNVFSVHPNPV
jgi:hypothetical protein